MGLKLKDKVERGGGYMYNIRATTVTIYLVGMPLLWVTTFVAG